jgi:hypothetical protein
MARFESTTDYSTVSDDRLEQELCKWVAILDDVQTKEGEEHARGIVNRIRATIEARSQLAEA